MKEVSEKTEVSVGQDLFAGDVIEFEAELYITIIILPHSSGEIEVLIKRPFQQNKSYTIRPGDTFEVKHEFNVKRTYDTDKCLFPISIFANGVKYSLRRTKQGKLLLIK